VDLDASQPPLHPKEAPDPEAATGGWQWMADAAPSRIVWVGVGFVAGLSVASLLASGAVLGARATLEDRLGAMAQKTGRQVTVGTISLGLTSGLRVRELSLSYPGSEATQLSIDEIETDLGLQAVLTGRTTPERLRVKGLRVAARVTERGLEGFDDLLKRAEPMGGSEGAGHPLQVSIEDASARLEIALHGQPPLTIVAGKVGLAGLIGPLRAATLAGDGEIAVGGRQTQVDFQLSPEVARFSLRSPLQVPLQAGGARVLVGLSGAARRASQGSTTIDNLEVQAADGKLAVGRLEAIDGGWDLLPDPGSLAGLVLEELESPRLRAQHLEVELGSGEGGPWPRSPRRLSGRGVWVETPGGALEVRAGLCALDLPRTAIAALAAGRWSEAVAGVALVDTEMRLTLPANRLPGAVLAPPEEAWSAPYDLFRRRELKQLVAALSGLPIYLRNGRLEVADPGGAPVIALHGAAADLGMSPEGDLSLVIDTELRRGEDSPGRIALSATLDREGVPRRARGQVVGKDVANLLSRLSDHLTITPDSQVELDFAYAAAEEGSLEHHLTAKVKLSDFGFEWWRIAHAPLADIDAQVEIQVSFDTVLHRTTLEVPRFQLGDAHFKGQLVLDTVPGKPPKFQAQVEMPRQDCARVAASIPRPLIPRLIGFEARGEIEARASLTADLSRPRELELSVDGEVSACEIIHLSDQIDLGALKGPFVHHPIEPEKGRREDISLGPGSGEWVGFHLLPRFVVGAAVVTEDRGYYAHKGVRWELVQRALRLNFEKGKFVYGGSTITQQLVKNLFLTREKTLARKLEELIIAWQMEQLLTKEEILALYLNLIEYGPSIYGLKHASRFYFAKQPWELSPLEAAFIMGLKPWPYQGYKQWELGKVNGWWVTRLDKVLDMMHKREKVITAEERALSIPSQLVFRGPEEPTLGAARYVPPGAAPPAPRPE
jgi:hypothetical protein